MYYLLLPLVIPFALLVSGAGAQPAPTPTLEPRYHSVWEHLKQLYSPVPGATYCVRQESGNMWYEPTLNDSAICDVCEKLPDVILTSLLVCRERIDKRKKKMGHWEVLTESGCQELRLKRTRAQLAETRRFTRHQIEYWAAQEKAHQGGHLLAEEEKAKEDKMKKEKERKEREKKAREKAERMAREEKKRQEEKAKKELKKATRRKAKERKQKDKEKKARQERKKKGDAERKRADQEKHSQDHHNQHPPNHPNVPGTGKKSDSTTTRQVDNADGGPEHGSAQQKHPVDPSVQKSAEMTNDRSKGAVTDHPLPPPIRPGSNRFVNGTMAHSGTNGS